MRFYSIVALVVVIFWSVLVHHADQKCPPYQGEHKITFEMVVATHPS